jgi:hypothetical protein
VAVRRLLHQLRSHAIENCTGQCKATFDYGGTVPTRDRAATRRSVLAAVLVYHLTLLARFDSHLDLRTGLLGYPRAA